jgi:hypothetical protein
MEGICRIYLGFNKQIIHHHHHHHHLITIIIIIIKIIIIKPTKPNNPKTLFASCLLFPIHDLGLLPHGITGGALLPPSPCSPPASTPITDFFGTTGVLPPLLTIPPTGEEKGEEEEEGCGAFDVVVSLSTPTRSRSRSLNFPAISNFLFNALPVFHPAATCSP